MTISLIFCNVVIQTLLQILTILSLFPISPIAYARDGPVRLANSRAALGKEPANYNLDRLFSMIQFTLGIGVPFAKSPLKPKLSKMTELPARECQELKATWK